MPRELEIFIGPEGSGKTTLAKMLSKDTNKPYISVGDMLRRKAEDPNDKSEAAAACREMFKKHSYLNPNLLLLIQKEYFEKQTLPEGGVVDGALRTIIEVQGFPSMLEETGIKMPAVVFYLKVPQEVSIKRLAGENGRKREDDTLDGILNRLKFFNTNLTERIALIESLYPILHIDVTGSIPETYEKLLKALREIAR